MPFAYDGELYPQMRQPCSVKLRIPLELAMLLPYIYEQLHVLGMTQNLSKIALTESVKNCALTLQLSKVQARMHICKLADAACLIGRDKVLLQPDNIEDTKAMWHV